MLKTTQANILFSEVNTPIEAIIFDCDGILVDTEFLKFQAWQRAAANQNYSFTTDEYKPLVGYSGRAIAQAIKQKKDAEDSHRSLDEEKLLNERNNYYKELHQNPANIPPIWPLIEFAKRLASVKHKYGYKLGLASSASVNEIQKNLKAYGLENIFDTIISGGDHLQDIQDVEGTNKPKPYIYQRIAEWMKVNPRNCVVLEDTDAGVNAGALAGMFVIAVPNDFTRHHQFKLANKILSLQEITALKDKI